MFIKVKFIIPNCIHWPLFYASLKNLFCTNSAKIDDHENVMKTCTVCIRLGVNIWVIFSSLFLHPQPLILKDAISSRNTILNEEAGGDNVHFLFIHAHASRH